MNDKTLHIIIDASTKRLKYIFDFMFGTLFDIPFQLIEKKDFNGEDLPNLIFYTSNDPNYKIWFKSHPILLENGIREIEFDFAEYQNFRYPFSINDGGLLAFDPFALGFYFLTQYQEWLPNLPLDNHGRFMVKNSKIFPYIEFPMVEVAAKIIRMELEKNGFVFPPKKNHYSFTPTFDLDVAFAHLAKPLKRHVLGSAKLIVNREFSQVAERVKVWIKPQNDSFDVFDEILNSLIEGNFQAIFFALVGKNSEFDHNNHPKSKRYRELLLKLSTHHHVELHSSYFSKDKLEFFTNEKKCVESIIGKKVIANRQHFLRYRLPEYLYLLLKQDITDDYSVGFTDFWGYRAGTSFSYQAFDLLKNEVLPITMHPFVFMDTALKKMFNGDVVLITDKMIELIDDAKQNGVPLIGVWHNYAMPSESLYLESFINVISNAKND